MKPKKTIRSKIGNYSSILFELLSAEFKTAISNRNLHTEFGRTMQFLVEPGTVKLHLMQDAEPWIHAHVAAMRLIRDA